MPRADIPLGMEIAAPRRRRPLLPRSQRAGQGQRRLLQSRRLLADPRQPLGLGQPLWERGNASACAVACGAAAGGNGHSKALALGSASYISAMGAALVGRGKTICEKKGKKEEGSSYWEKHAIGRLTGLSATDEQLCALRTAPSLLELERWARTAAGLK